MDNSRKVLEQLGVTVGSGNVFADLELPGSEERLLKAELSLAIRQLIEERNLTQQAAALVLNTEQPRVSDILRGHVRGFSVERLLSYVTALDCDVQIRIVPHTKTPEGGKLKKGKTHVQMT